MGSTFFGSTGSLNMAVDRLMQSFGSKQQLPHEIVTNDPWFQNAEEMTQFLIQYFSTDNRKEHHLVEASKTIKVRVNKRGELILRQCRKSHVIAVNKDGLFSKMLHFTIKILLLLLI